MKIVVNFLRLIGVVIIAAYSSTLGLLVRLFTGSTDKCIDTAVTLFSNSIFFISNTKLEVSGNRDIERSPGKIYVSNHESHFDPPALALACPHTLYFIAKKELKYVPFIGWYIWLSGMIFIDRKNKSKATESIRKAGEKVKNGKNVISFAEGTRSKTGKLNQFRRGAFKMALSHGLDIVPVGIAGSREVLASGSMQINAGRTIKVKLGEVLKAEDNAQLTVEELAAKTQQIVAGLISDLKTEKNS